MFMYFAVPLENGPPRIIPSPLNASLAEISGEAAAIINITINPTNTPANMHKNEDKTDFVPSFL